MEDELDIVRDVSRRLNGAGIAYMLTGSMAMNYYAQPRLTRDVDFVIELEDSDAGTIVNLFRPDYYVSETGVSDSIGAKSIFNLIHEASVIKVDCVVRKDTVYRRLKFGRRQKIEIDDFSTWIATKEDLIISKLDWAKDSRSEIQVADVKNLIASGCDHAYVDNWTKELGLSKLWQEVQS